MHRGGGVEVNGHRGSKEDKRVNVEIEKITPKNRNRFRLARKFKFVGFSYKECKGFFFSQDKN